MQTRQSLLDHYHEMRQNLLDAIDDLTDDQLTDPSLDGWSVKDHLAHIAFWDEIRANDTAWPAEEMENHHELGYAMRRDLSVDQAKWELATTHQRVLDAVTAATDRGLEQDNYGESGVYSEHEAEHTGWISRWRKEQGF